jgi:hypothetical protein
MEMALSVCVFLVLAAKSIIYIPEIDSVLMVTV